MKQRRLWAILLAVLVTGAPAPAFAADDRKPSAPASRPAPAWANPRQIQPPPPSPAAQRPSRPSGQTFVRYPGNWAEVQRRQERFGHLMTGMEDAPTRDTRRKLSRVVPEIRLEPAVTFSDAVDRIRAGSGANIVVNWPALELVGITREQEVTLPRLTNLPWARVLDLVLRQITAGLGGLARLDWAIQDGILTISTQEDLSTHLTTRVYDIGDLLVPRLVVPRGSGPQGSVSSGGSPGSGSAAGVPSGQAP